MTRTLASAVVSRAAVPRANPEGCAHGNCGSLRHPSSEFQGKPLPRVWLPILCLMEHSSGFLGPEPSSPWRCDPPRAHQRAQERGPERGPDVVRNTGIRPSARTWVDLEDILLSG